MYNKTYIFKDEVYSVHKIYDLIHSEESHVVLQDAKVKVEGLRLKSFTRNEPCVSCNRQGVQFRIATSRYSRKKDWYLTLWSEDGIQMTKDHIVPSSKGGANHLGNIQTMCTKCNSKKGSTVTPEDFEKGTVVENYDPKDYAKAPANFVEPKAYGLTFREIFNKYGDEDFKGTKFRETVIGKLSTSISKYGKKHRCNVYLIKEDHPNYQAALDCGMIDNAKYMITVMEEVVESYRGVISTHSTKMRYVPLKIRRRIMNEYKERNNV